MLEGTVAPALGWTLGRRIRRIVVAPVLHRSLHGRMI